MSGKSPSLEAAHSLSANKTREDLMMDDPQESENGTQGEGEDQAQDTEQGEPQNTRVTLPEIVRQGLVAPANDKVPVELNDTFMNYFEQTFGQGCYFDKHGCLWCPDGNGNYQLVSCPV